MRRGEIYWADLGPPAGRRPVLVLSRDAAIPVLNRIVIAPITRTIREIRSELPVGREQGLPSDGVANCDSLLTIPKDTLQGRAVGRLELSQSVRLDAALRFSLDIRY